MKVYFSPGACSLATRISLHEAGLEAEYERVDLRSKITERGYDYNFVNRKGCVPMLVLEDGESVTENVAILSLIAERVPELAPSGPHGHTRMIEYLSYLSTELHVAFKPLWDSPTDIARAKAVEAVEKRLELIESCIKEMYVFGPRFTVVDAYLFVMLRWVKQFGIPTPPELFGYFERLAKRPAVQRALSEEGLDLRAPNAAEDAPMTNKVMLT